MFSNTRTRSYHQLQVVNRYPLPPTTTPKLNQETGDRMEIVWPMPLNTLLNPTIPKSRVAKKFELNTVGGSYYDSKNDIDPSTRLRVSKSSYINTSLAFGWIQHFKEHSKRCQKGKWRLLVFDGHESHQSDEILQFCCPHWIIPFILPPHSTHCGGISTNQTPSSSSLAGALQFDCFEFAKKGMRYTWMRRLKQRLKLRTELGSARPELHANLQEKEKEDERISRNLEEFQLPQERDEQRLDKLHDN